MPHGMTVNIQDEVHLQLRIYAAKRKLRIYKALEEAIRLWIRTPARKRAAEKGE